MLSSSQQLTRAPLRVSRCPSSLGGFRTASSVSLESYVEGTSVLPVRAPRVHEIKGDRFAQELEAFKNEYEKPIVNQFLAISTLKHNIAQKKARAFRGPPVKKAKIEKMKKKRKMDLFRRRERATENFLHNSVLTTQTTKPNRFLSGRTRKDRERRETFFRTLLKPGNFWEPYHPDAEFDADNPPPGEAGRPHRAHKWEMSLEDSKLGVILSREITARGLPLDWDNYNSIIERRGIGQGLHEGKALAMSRRLADGDDYVPEVERFLDRPALRKFLPEPDLRNKTQKITKVTDENPIAFEITAFPLDVAVYDPYPTKKVTMYVKLAPFNLPPAVKKRLRHLLAHNHQQEMLKPRYDHGSDIVKITSRRKRTLLENRGWVIKYFREAMAEAWKADLNFIPPPDTFIAPIQLAPHLMLAFEERLAAAKEEQEFRDSFDRVKEQAEKGYTLFRLYDNAIESAEQRIPSKMQVRAHRKFLEATERGTKFELALNGPVTADLMVVDNLPEACTPARLMTLFSSFSPRGAIVRVRKQHVIGILEFHSQEQRDVAVRDAPALVNKGVADEKSLRLLPLLDGDIAGFASATMNLRRLRHEAKNGGKDSRSSPTAASVSTSTSKKDASVDSVAEM